MFRIRFVSLNITRLGWISFDIQRKSMQYLRNITRYRNKHNTCIPSWSDVETVFSTSFQRGIHVVCLWGSRHRGGRIPKWIMGIIPRLLLQCHLFEPIFIIWSRVNPEKYQLHFTGFEQKEFFLRLIIEYVVVEFFFFLNIVSSFDLVLTFRNVNCSSQGSNWNNFFCVVIEYVVVDFF